MSHVNRVFLTAAAIGLLVLVTQQWSAVSALSGIDTFQALIGFAIPLFVLSLASWGMGPVTDTAAPPIPEPSRTGAGAAALLAEIAGNARKVNQASTARQERLTELMKTASELRAAMRTLRDGATENEQNLAATTEAAGRISAATRSVGERMAENVTMAGKLKDAIDSFSESCHSIEASAEQIKSIAGKTGLLAVNASIEASRAGEAGAGFAVVAQQVGELARTTDGSASSVFTAIEALLGRLNETTKSITGMLAGMEVSIGDIDHGKDAAGEITSILAGATGRTNEITEAMQRQIALFDQIVMFLDQAKQDTEAAISGSAKNVDLADNALRELGADPQNLAA